MPIMINRGKEILRISPKDSKKIEYSTNQGRTWMIRYNGSSNVGSFIDLMDWVGKFLEQQTMDCSIQPTMEELGCSANADCQQGMMAGSSSW